MGIEEVIAFSFYPFPDWLVNLAKYSKCQPNTVNSSFQVTLYPWIITGPSSSILVVLQKFQISILQVYYFEKWETYCLEELVSLVSKQGSLGGEEENVLCEMQRNQLTCWRRKANVDPLTVMLFVETYKSFVTDFSGIKSWVIPCLVFYPRDQPPSAEFQSWWCSFETFIYALSMLLWLFT